ncbi:MAG: GTP 3',8-cyclase MoaA [Oscillospiraceae bacterium]|nr:GTP 3',8-cyclase MoaA [Oscillospiraceae bacterium]
MTDGFGRKIEYLRLSVTDLCNLRCQYCMGPEGVEKRDHRDILSHEEIEEIVRAAVKLGMRKVRVTGGEPLVRPGIVDICRRIGAIDGVEELCVTTNGLRLPELAEELRQAGVRRLNISLDTLKPERYREITRIGTLEKALAGLEAARAAGFPAPKLNCVLMGGINDDEIPDFVALTEREPVSVRFIELMPIGPCRDWDKSRFIPADAVLRAVPELTPVGGDGVARLYRLPGGKGTVGLIRPVSDHFCPACNRIRITADGKLKPCLHSAAELPLRGLHGEELEAAIRTGILAKPQRHHLEVGSESIRNMNAIGG